MKIKKSVHLRKWILSILGILIIIISFQISQSVANKKPKLPNEKKDFIKEVNIIKVKKTKIAKFAKIAKIAKFAKIAKICQIC